MAICYIILYIAALGIMYAFEPPITFALLYFVLAFLSQAIEDIRGHMIQPVTKISGETVEHVTKRCSPTFVMRAIKAHLIKWKTVSVSIVTERKYGTSTETN